MRNSNLDKGIYILLVVLPLIMEMTPLNEYYSFKFLFFFFVFSYHDFKNHKKIKWYEWILCLVVAPILLPLIPT